MSPRRVAFRLRYADVAATLALVLAMGGTAYAVTALDPDSVYTAAIQSQAVTTPKLADEAVTTSKIAPGSVTVGDLAAGGTTGQVRFKLPAHGCKYLSVAVPGAGVGQVALLSWRGANPPQGVVVGPPDVAKAGTVVVSACNVTDHKVTGHKVKVRVVTLG